MKQILFIAALLLLGKTASAQVTINNTSLCTFTIVYAGFGTACQPWGTPVILTVPIGTWVFPSLGAPIEAFSINDPCVPSGGNTTVGTPPCHSATATFPAFPCCLATGANWAPAGKGTVVNIF